MLNIYESPDLTEDQKEYLLTVYEFMDPGMMAMQQSMEMQQHMDIHNMHLNNALQMHQQHILQDQFMQRNRNQMMMRHNDLSDDSGYMIHQICNDVKRIKSPFVITKYERLYKFRLGEDVKNFFTKNNGGIPKRQIFKFKGKPYEVRCFLSFNDGEYNSIKLPLASFQKETNGKMFPLAKDSGDNYYCLDLETGEVSYWSHDDDTYYPIANSFINFIALLS